MLGCWGAAKSEAKADRNSIAPNNKDFMTHADMQ
jgi:hypothetical protein